MEDRETARMRKYGESKTAWIMMATVSHVTSGVWDLENFRPMDSCWHECTYTYSQALKKNMNLATVKQDFHVMLSTRTTE